MENSQISMLEIANNLMEKKRTPQSVRKLINEVLEIKGFDDPDGVISAQLYIDITTSSKFVYMGNEEWDLKSRQSLDEFDKDGAAFNSKEDLLEIEKELEAALPVEKFDDDNDDEIIEESAIISEADFEDDNYEDDENENLVKKDLDADDDEDDDSDEIINDDYMDEDKYNDYMDSYEDMYDE